MQVSVKRNDLEEHRTERLLSDDTGIKIKLSLVEMVILF